MYNSPRYLWRRSLARLIDLTLVIALVQASDSNINIFGLYVAYNFLFCFVNGATVGRQILGITYLNEKYTFFKMLGHEILFFALGWVIFFEIFFSTNHLVHDRFCAIKPILR